MTCPHCAVFTKETFPKLKAAYIDTGKVRYVFREFPLDQLALLGAELARCIARGDGPKYFGAIDVLFATQDEWVNNKPLEPLKRLTRQLGMNDGDFEACANNETIGKGIIATRDYAYDRLKVSATPSFFVNGQLLQGEASLEDFAKIIDPILAQGAGAPAKK
jgi:protein-disulfide isomerase